MANTAEVINLFDKAVPQEQVQQTNNEVQFVKADTENGFTRIADEMLEYICQAELTGRQMRVLMAIVRKTYGFNKKYDWLAASQIKELMNYAGGENHLREDIKALKSKNIIISNGKEIGPNPVLSEWILTKKDLKTGSRKQDKNSPETGSKDPENGTKTAQKRDPQKKDTITKDNNTKEYEENFANQVVQSFNKTLSKKSGGAMPAVSSLSPKRISAIKARTKDLIKLPGNETLDPLNIWTNLFEYIKQSDLLNDRLGKGWNATLDWIINPNNLVKIIEGNYENKFRSNVQTNTVSDDKWYENLGL